MNLYVIILVVVFGVAAVLSAIRKRYLGAVLWLVIGLGAYLVTESIMQPIRFQQVRDARYSRIFNSLETIGDAQKLYRSTKGHFAPSFDSLYSFLDNENVYLTQTREEKVKEYDKVYRITVEREIKVTDTVAVLPAIEQLRNTSSRFAEYEKKNGSYKSLKYVPVEIPGEPRSEFEIAAGTVERGKNTVPVFEVKVNKAVVLADQDEDLVANELEAVVGVRGDVIKVGDINVPTTEGNWGKDTGK